MKNVTEVLTADVFDSGKIGAAIQQIIALPLPSNEKTALLQGWSRAVGARVSASQYAKVAASGTDNQ